MGNCKEKTRPDIDRVFDLERRWSAADQLLIAVLNATEAPVVTIPIALTHPTAGTRPRRNIHGSRLLARDCAADDRAADNATGNRRAEGALRARRRRGERGECCDRKQRGKCLLHVWDSPERCGASRAPGDLTRD